MLSFIRSAPVAPNDSGDSANGTRGFSGSDSNRPEQLKSTLRTILHRIQDGGQRCINNVNKTIFLYLSGMRLNWCNELDVDVFI